MEGECRRSRGCGKAKDEYRGVGICDFRMGVQGVKMRERAVMWRHMCVLTCR